MLTSFILYAVWGVVWVLTLPFRLVSDVTVDTGVGSAITTATQYIASWNMVLPLTAFFIVVGLALALEIGIAVYRIVMWVKRSLPTQS